MARLSVISLSLILVTASAFAQPATSEPTHDGKPLSGWLKGLADADAKVRTAAAEAIGKMGAKAKSAVPALIKAVQDQDERAAAAAVDALGQIGPDAKEAMPTLFKALQEDKPPVSVLTLGIAMGRINIDAPETRIVVRTLYRFEGRWSVRSPSLIYGGYLQEFPAASVRHSVALLRHDGDAQVRAVAAEVLGRSAQKGNPTHKNPTPSSALDRAGEVGKEVVPALLESLKDEDAKVRREVVQALRRVDAKQMKAAIPVVIELLSRTDGVIANNVTDSTWGSDMLGSVAGEAAPMLIQVLDQKDETVHLRAVGTLAGLKYEATAPALTKALSDPSPRVRKGAAHALGMRRASAAAARPALIAILNDPEPEVRMQVALALVTIDAKRAQPAVPTLVGLLRDNDLELRRRAVDALRRLGPIAEPATQSLLPLLKDQTPELRFEAAEALIVISREKAAATVPILAEALKQERYRSRAVVLAGRLGPAAQPLLSNLLPLLKHEDANQRLWAAEAVVSIDRMQAQLAVPVIAALFNAKELTVTLNPLDVVRVLERLGPDAKAAAPALRAALQDAQAGARFAPEAAVALAKVDPTQTEAALTFLRQGLKAKQTRFRALRAVEQLSAAAKSAVPELTELLKDEAEDSYKELAARVLGQIGADAKAAVPALKTLLKHEEEEVRNAAQEALKKIDPTAASNK